jgi:hypothetical protein
LIVTDYFDMLKQELSGSNYNRAKHQRPLIPKLGGRSSGSVEFKHCNISAILQDQGHPFIDGYKPRPNTQKLLREVVTRKWQGFAAKLSL